MQSIFFGTLLPMYPYCIVNATYILQIDRIDLFKYNIHTLYGYQP